MRVGDSVEVTHMAIRTYAFYAFRITDTSAVASLLFYVLRPLVVAYYNTSNALNTNKSLLCVSHQ